MDRALQGMPVPQIAAGLPLGHDGEGSAVQSQGIPDVGHLDLEHLAVRHGDGQPLLCVKGLQGHQGPVAGGQLFGIHLRPLLFAQLGRVFRFQTQPFFQLARGSILFDFRDLDQLGIAELDGFDLVDEFPGLLIRYHFQDRKQLPQTEGISALDAVVIGLPVHIIMEVHGVDDPVYRERLRREGGLPQLALFQCKGCVFGAQDFRPVLTKMNDPEMIRIADGKSFVIGNGHVDGRIRFHRPAFRQKGYIVEMGELKIGDVFTAFRVLHCPESFLTHGLQVIIGISLILVQGADRKFRILGQPSLCVKFSADACLPCFLLQLNSGQIDAALLIRCILLQGQSRKDEQIGCYENDRRAKGQQDGPLFFDQCRDSR